MRATSGCEVEDAIATVTLDRPDALNALTVPMKAELLAALRTIGRGPGRPGGGADRSRASVLRRPGSARAPAARCGPTGRGTPRALQPDRPGDARARPADRRGDQRGRRGGGGVPGVRLRPAGRRREVRASCSRSGGSGWSRQRRDLVPAAARRAGQGGRAGAASANPVRRRMRSVSAWWPRVVPATPSSTRPGRWRPGSRASRPRALALTKRALERGVVGRPRCGPGGRGVPAGDRRGDRRSRRGDRGLPREAAAAVHRGVARRPFRRSGRRSAARPRLAP